MKKTILASLLVSLLVFSGCIKGNENNVCTNKLPSSEASAMQAYATANGLSVVEHASGIYYQVMNPGSGATANLNSRVYVRYKARYTSNNNLFDEQTNSDATGWFLNTLIPAWQIALPLIQEGGSIKLIVPSSLAYGCQGYHTIPGDAVLYFEIELVDVQ